MGAPLGGVVTDGKTTGSPKCGMIAVPFLIDLAGADRKSKSFNYGSENPAQRRTQNTTVETEIIQKRSTSFAGPNARIERLQSWKVDVLLTAVHAPR